MTKYNTLKQAGLAVIKAPEIIAGLGAEASIAVEDKIHRSHMTQPPPVIKTKKAHHAGRAKHLMCGPQ